MKNPGFPPTSLLGKSKPFLYQILYILEESDDGWGEIIYMLMVGLYNTVEMICALNFLYHKNLKLNFEKFIQNRIAI